jgi:hypothetical protein
MIIKMRRKEPWLCVGGWESNVWDGGCSGK